MNGHERAPRSAQAIPWARSRHRATLRLQPVVASANPPGTRGVHSPQIRSSSVKLSAFSSEDSDLPLGVPPFQSRPCPYSILLDGVYVYRSSPACRCSGCGCYPSCSWSSPHAHMPCTATTRTAMKFSGENEQARRRLSMKQHAVKHLTHLKTAESHATEAARATSVVSCNRRWQS